MTTIDRLATLRAVAAPILAEQRTERERQETKDKAYDDQYERNFHVIARYLGLVGEDETITQFGAWQQLTGNCRYTITHTGKFLVVVGDDTEYIQCPYITDRREVCGERLAFIVCRPDESFREAVASKFIGLGIIEE